MNDYTRKAIESARHLVESVRAGRTSSVYRSTLEYAEALADAAGELDRLTLALHRCCAHPDFEYETTQTARKSGDDPRVGLPGDGWEPNDVVENHEYADGKVVKEYWRNWERFQFHEDNYWRRRRTPKELP